MKSHQNLDSSGQTVEFCWVELFLVHTKLQLAQQAVISTCCVWKPVPSKSPRNLFGAKFTAQKLKIAGIMSRALMISDRLHCCCHCLSLSLVPILLSRVCHIGWLAALARLLLRSACFAGLQTQIGG